MLRIILFLAGLYGMYNGFQKINIDTAPYVGSVESIEEGGNRNYDYYELDGCTAVKNFAYFTSDKENSRVVKQYLFGIVSTNTAKDMTASVIRAINNYVIEQNITVNEISQSAYDSIKNAVLRRPTVFIQSSKDVIMSADDYEQLLDSTVNTKISGIKLQSESDLDEVIKDGLRQDGIDLDNCLIIQHNQKPSDSRKDGYWNILLGLVMAGIGFFLFRS